MLTVLPGSVDESGRDRFGTALEPQQSYRAVSVAHEAPVQEAAIGRCHARHSTAEGQGAALLTCWRSRSYFSSVTDRSRRFINMKTLTFSTIKYTIIIFIGTYCHKVI